MSALGLGVAYDPLRDSRHRTATSARDLADWLTWLELGKKAARTLDSYERTCAVLLRMFPTTAFEDFTDGDLMHAMLTFPERSRHINKAALNNWFTWGYKHRRIPANPVDLLPSMRYVPSRVLDVFTEMEVAALCALPPPDGQLVTILFNSGIRNSEACNLTLRRVEFQSGYLLVREGAKGSKDRRVPLLKDLVTAVEELTVLEGLNPSDYLWYTRPGGSQRRVRRDRPCPSTSFAKWWGKCITAADVRYLKPHTTRHTFATRLRQLGMEMEEIQLLLGHESVRTTMDIYVHTEVGRVGDRLREMVGDGI